MLSILKRIIPRSQIGYLYTLHLVNDGFYASFLLLLPFIAKDLHISLTETGLLGTVVNSISILLALPSAYLATRFGGMRLLLFAIFLYALGYIGVGFAHTYLLLFPCFILAGIGFGLFHPIGFALIAKYAHKGKRGKHMGDFTSIGEVGKIGFSAFLTFIIVWVGLHVTAILYGAVALGVGGLVYLLFRHKREHFVTSHSSSDVPLREVLLHKRFWFATLANFFDSFASSALFIFLPFLLLNRGADPALLGLFSAAYFIGTFAGKSVLGRIADRVGSTKVFIASELLMAALIILLATTTMIPLIIACSIILGIFTKGTVPVTKTMVVEAVDHHKSFEKAFGVNSLISAIASTAAPVFLGFISDTYSIATAFFVMAVAALFSTIPALYFHISKDNSALLTKGSEI